MGEEPHIAGMMKPKSRNLLQYGLNSMNLRRDMILINDVYETKDVDTESK